MLDKKRVTIIGIAIILLIAIIVAVYFFLKNNTEIQITEYTPQEEISDEQMRETMVSLYFLNENKLVPEARLIDVKELINNPYEKILNMLLEGPKNENLQKIIPEETKINKIQKEGENLILDFNEKFIEVEGEEKQKLLIQSIVKTLTELTEINGIKIQINGEKDKEFINGKINFKEIFTRDF